MNINFFDIVYVVTNIFGTYIIYVFMNIFFEDDNVNKKLEMLSYIVYYVVISFIYILLKIPIVMTACNICLFFLLSLNYKSNVKKRVACAVLIYLILMCIKMVVVFLTGYLKFPIFEKNNFDSIFGIIIIKIISYAVALILSNFKNIKKV